MSNLDFNPSQKTLRQFAAAWVLIFSAWGAHHLFMRENFTPAVFLGALAAAGAPGLVAPWMVRRLYIICMIAAFPIGWSISQFTLLVLFYCIITPIALLFKLRGRDALFLKSAAGRDSYWMPKAARQDISSYFRQY
ncbi:MAG: hypothetical protein ABSF52_07865 [Syntrophobacteraceae bacterium]|jgi:hypothetical protein